MAEPARNRSSAFGVWMLAFAVAFGLALMLDRADQRHRTDRAAAAWAREAALLDAAGEVLTARLAERAAAVDAVAVALEAVAPAERADALDAALALAPEGTTLGAWIIPRDGVRYARRAGGGVTVDESANYTEPANEAFHTALVNGSGWLTLPPTAGTPWSAQYGRTLYDPDGVAFGVVYGRIGWESVAGLTRGLQLGRTGYAFVVTPSGELVDHPRVDRSVAGVSLHSLAARLGDSDLAAVGERVRRGDAGFVDRADPRSGTRERIRYRPLGESGWSLIALTAEREAVPPDLTEERASLNVAFCRLLVAYTAVGAAISLLGATGPLLGWMHAIAWSLLMTQATASLWASVRGPQARTEEGVRIVDASGLDRYLHLKERQTFGEETGERFVRIPTGVFLQSLDFPSANNATVTGVVWQRLAASFPDDIEPGIVFPESVDSTVEPLYERDIIERGVPVGTLKGWSFVLTLRERFRFERYPFDTKAVLLRMWPRDFDRPVVLVPDLDAYPLIEPGRLPGLDNAFVLAGWEPLHTFFQYREASYSTDFGNRAYVGHEQYPELTFTLDVQRAFVSTFVSDLIPLVVVAFLLFGVLQTVTTLAERTSATGFDFTNVLGACSGVAFVVVLGHIQLRTSLAGQSTTYLEWYYFVMYVALVLVAINAWHVIAPRRPRYVEWEDNLVARLVFFPLLTTGVLVATVYYFYPTDLTPTR